MSIWEKLSSGVYLIAEMSANHAGKLENALEIVRAAKASGADCLKIQTYTADTMTLQSGNEYFRIKGGLWDGYTLYDLYSEAHTPWEWHQAIKSECEAAGLDFLSTPFDRTSVDFLEGLGVEFYKIASFELTDIPLISYTASKGKPMVISCGMGSLDEIKAAVDACYSQGNRQIVLLKCTSEYPAKYSEMNIATITDMRRRFKLPVGLSDHSMGVLAPVTAVASGATVIEKHFCLSRNLKNPDSEFSMEPSEFAEMSQMLNLGKELIGTPSYTLSQSERASTVFRRSVFVKKPVKAGEAFSRDNICVIRPSHGIPPEFYDDLMGHTACAELKPGMPLNFGDISDLGFLLKLKKSAFYTERLELTGICVSDGENIVKWRQDPSVIRYFLNTGPVSTESHRIWFENYLKDTARFDFIITENASRKAIGIAGVQNINYPNSYAEVAYLIGGADFQGFGFAGEAVRGLEDFVRRKLRISRFGCVIHRDNTASLKLARNLGYAKTAGGEFEKFEKRDGAL